jgi:Flp pilus assembly protein TadG
MASDSPARFRQDESGAVFLEFTVAAMFFFTLLFAAAEFSFMFYQWNIATKATQFGARLAAISNPVASNLSSLTGLEAGASPGAAMPSYSCTCSGASGSCTGTVPAGAAACTYSAAAMHDIVYGRGDNNQNNCNDPGRDNGRNMGMCDIYYRITPANVVVTYENTGLGYAGRPSAYPGITGAPVPTITVELTGLSYNFIAIDSLAGLRDAMPLPPLTTTISGEDLRGY